MGSPAKEALAGRLAAQAGKDARAEDGTTGARSPVRATEAPCFGATPVRAELDRLAERLLLLGGTREGVELARELAGLRGVEVTYSLAGRTRRPAAVPVPVRSGGFGGADGLEAYLREAGIRLVVDATHPYAESISGHAAVACERASVPRLILHRPPWTRGPGDRWIEVADSEGAAGVLPTLGQRVFLAVGSGGLEPFVGVPRVSFMVRSVEPPAVALDSARFEVLLDRGPFDFASERRLLESRRIEVVVSKNSGGPAARPKLDAARALGLPVVMIARPRPPAGERVDSIAAARVWVEEQVRRR